MWREGTGAVAGKSAFDACGHVLRSVYWFDLNLGDCLYCQTSTVISRLCTIVEDLDDEKTVQRIKRWARATVQKSFQLGLEGEDFMNVAFPIAGSIGSFFLALGEAWEAKQFLEYTIVEMNRLGSVRVGWRRMATLELAHCNEELGNKAKAVELLQALFKDVYPKLVALSSEDFESYLKDFCTFHQRDALVRLLLGRGIDTSENKWKVDAEEFRLRLTAVEMIRRLFPETVQEVKEGDIDESTMCHGERDDRC
jgi:hypothetical protein